MWGYSKKKHQAYNKKPKSAIKASDFQDSEGIKRHIFKKTPMDKNQVFARRYNELSQDARAKLLQEANQYYEWEKATKEDKPVVHVDLESPLILSNRYKQFQNLPPFQKIDWNGEAILLKVQVKTYDYKLKIHDIYQDSISFKVVNK